MTAKIARNLLTTFARNFSTSKTKVDVERIPESLAQQVKAIKSSYRHHYVGFHGTSTRSLNSERIFRWDNYSTACDSARYTCRLDGGLPLVLLVGSKSEPKAHFMGYSYFPNGSEVEIFLKHQISMLKSSD